MSTRTNNSQTTFDEILQMSLRLGVVDIFTVIAWQVNGTPSNQIVEELKTKVLAQRSEVV